MHNRFLIIKIILFFVLITISNASYIQYMKWYDANNGNKNPITELPYKIGDKITFEMKVTENVNDLTPCLQGDAKVNIGKIVEDIFLYDTWLGDPADGIYKYDYYIKGDEKFGCETTSAEIKGFFRKITENAINSGDIKSENLISIDAKPPLVLNGRSSINPFNPFLSDRTEISYQLEERCENVDITIIGDGFNFTKHLSMETAEQGVNFTSWDGKDDNGDFADNIGGLERITPDGIYIVQIKAFDFAGNQSQTATIEIKLTTVNLQIENIALMPTVFYPYGSCSLKWDVVLLTEIEGRDKFGNIKKYGGENDKYQLEVLDFGSINSQNLVYPWQEPWIVYSLSEFNSEKKETQICTPANGDLSSDVDMDEYYVQQYNREFGQIAPLGYVAKQDIGDEDPGNDHDNLERIAELNEIQQNLHKYKIKCGFGRNDLGSSPGSYYFRIMATLSGRKFEYKGPGKTGDIEKWNMVPNLFQGENISSLTMQAIFEIITPPFYPGDNIDPWIVTYTPLGDVEPGFIGGKGEIAATIADNTGINLTKSRIEVYGPLGDIIKGKSINNGDRKISYQLDAPITDPGTYTVYLYVTDKFNNGKSFTKQFNVLDKVGPKFSAENPRTDSLIEGKIKKLTVGITDEKGVGLVEEILSELGAKGHYEVILKNKNGDVIAKTGDGKTITKFTRASDEKNISGNYESGEISFEFNSDLLEDIADNNPDIYTWKVIAFDANNNPSYITYTFNFSFSNIEIKENNKVYASISPTAKIKNNPNIKIADITVKSTSPKNPITPPYKLLGSVIEFTPNDFEFDQDITLFMYYTDELLNTAFVKDADLKVYVLDGKEWNISSFIIDKSEKKFSFKTNKIVTQYAIVYPYKEPEKKAAANYFNPMKDEYFIFYFDLFFPNKKLTKAKITIYNLSGEYIAEIKENKGVNLKENLAVWDGRNEVKSIVNNGVYIAVIEVKDDANNTIYFKRLIAVVK